MPELVPDVCVIGCGRWGRNLIRVFDDIANVTVCCHTGDPDNARWLDFNYPSVDRTTEFDDVVAADPDAAVVATPIRTHYEYTRRLLEHDIPCFVEKPLTANVDTARRLATLSVERNVLLFVGYVFVHHPVFEHLLQLHRETPFEHVRFDWHKLGGFEEDIVANLASHDLAMAYRLFGRPDSVNLRYAVKGPDVRNIASISASFDGADVWIELNRLDRQKRKTVTAVTCEGDVYHWEDTELARLSDARNEYRTTFTTDREPLRVEIARFLECLNRGRQPDTDGEFGAVVTELFADL